MGVEISLVSVGALFFLALLLLVLITSQRNTQSQGKDKNSKYAGKLYLLCEYFIHMFMLI